MAKQRVLFGLFLTLALAPITQATTVTGGYITIDRVVAHTGSFSLIGEGFQLDGPITDGNGLFNVGRVGETFGASYFRSVNDLGVGVASIFGDGYSLSVPVSWSSLSAVRGSFLSALGPSFIFQQGVTTYEQPFTFSASLCGVTSGPTFDKPCTADFPSLTGAGTVEYSFYEELDQQGQALFFPRSATFTVSVPEPSTWSLFGVGLLASLFFGRRRTADNPMKGTFGAGHHVRGYSCPVTSRFVGS